MFKFSLPEKLVDLGKAIYVYKVFTLYTQKVMMTGQSYQKTIDILGVSNTIVHWLRFTCRDANWAGGHLQCHDDNLNENPENVLPGWWMLLHSNTMS